MSALIEYVPPPKGDELADALEAAAKGIELFCPNGDRLANILRATAEDARRHRQAEIVLTVELIDGDLDFQLHGETDR